MRYYESFFNYKIDPALIGDNIYAFNKYDGQNFVVKYNMKQKKFDAFGSRTHLVDETDEQFGKAVVIFKKNIQDKIQKMIDENRGKKGPFEGAKEIEFYFEYVGENSFCGVHDPNDEMHLILIDIWVYKKGYVDPITFCEMTKDVGIEVAEVVYKGKLDKAFIAEIENNDWNDPDAMYPTVKEGVVCKRTGKLKGQRLPKVKVKTNWWLNKVKSKYPENWEELI